MSALLSAALLLTACDVSRPKVDDSTSVTDPDDSDTTGCTPDSSALEVCNGIDDDCDGRTDEDVQQTYYVDNDGDGFGGGDPGRGCTLPEGTTVLGSDCDDADPAINPDADDVCNGIDDDCDGELEEGYGTWYTDLDNDGYGTDATARTGCDPGFDEVNNSGDCDDANQAFSPGAEDTCGDGVDQDCSGADLLCLFTGEYDLNEADAKVHAPTANWMAGEYMDVGDINGDGLDDVVLSAMYANNYNGGAAIIYGPVYGELSTEDAGYSLIGNRRTSSAGRSVAVGDVNGDGIDDVGIGAPDSTCKDWVFLGPLTADRAVDDAEIERTGTYDTEVGHGMDIADVNGDGQADLLIGAYEDDTSGRDAGAVYIEYGPVPEGSDTVNNRMNARLLGENTHAFAGRYVRAGAGIDGDVDGDGVGDILAAAPYASGGAPYAGAAYLVYGGVSGDLDLADADAKYVGENPNDYAGEGLALGDVNGDGLADVLLGTLTSSAYVVYGPGTDDGDLINASITLRGSGGYGLGLSGADVNGDGIGDLLVGANTANTANGRGSGQVFLYWGPLAGGLGVDDADATFLGANAGDGLGMSVGTGDLDGDGLGEVLMGAPMEGTGGGAGGALFVEYAVR